MKLGIAIAISATRPVMAGAPVPAAPVNTVPPSISGALTVGSVLTANPGTWTGYPLPHHAYQWLRNGSPISGATNLTHTLTAEDAGTDISVQVYGVNTEGMVPVTSPVVHVAAARAPPEPPAATGGTEIPHPPSGTGGQP